MHLHQNIKYSLFEQCMLHLSITDQQANKTTITFIVKRRPI